MRIPHQYCQGVEGGVGLRELRGGSVGLGESVGYLISIVGELRCGGVELGESEGYLISIVGELRGGGVGLEDLRGGGVGLGE